MLEIHPISLAGRVVRLEPLSTGHVPALTIAGNDDSIWRFMRYGLIRSEAQMAGLVQHLLEAQTRGTDLPFAVVHLDTGQAIGMTRYLNIEPENRSLEIGGTWYAVPYQRTAVNTECKLLLLRHAFETLGCVRVQIKTDLRNERSQAAIAALGAVREGVLRNHMILPDGTLRDSVFYSILPEEWPAVKTRLTARLARLMTFGDRPG